VCASESCSSSHDAQPTKYGNVNWALFLCHSEINPPFLNLKSLSSRVVARFLLGDCAG